ncbi:MAG: hypothetical protein ACPLXS_03700 [Candidatus Micrarchaeales archaeon]
MVLNCSNGLTTHQNLSLRVFWGYFEDVFEKCESLEEDKVLAKKYKKWKPRE